MSDGNKFRLRVLDAPLVPPGGSYAVPAWLALMRVFARMERRVNRMLAEHGLGHPQFEILLNLAMGEGITQQELAERLLVTKGNICVVLDKMEEKGWVERRIDAVDRRANRLYLTTAGRRLIARVAPQHEMFLNESISAISPAQQKALYESLAQLNAALRDAEAANA